MWGDMASKPGAKKRSANTCRGNSRAKDKDIAELKYRIAVLEKTAEVLNQAPMGVYEIDFRSPRFKSVNDYMCNVMGYSREELLAMSPVDIIDEASQARFRERIKKQLAGEKIDELVEYKGRMKDGREVYLALKNTFTYDEDGKPAGSIVFADDITDRKLAEEALRDSEEKFHKLADSANVGILLVQDEDIIYINQSLAALAGYTVEECKHLKYWDVMPQEKKEYIRWVGNARQHGWVAASRSELKIIGKDGREIWLDCSWADPLIGGRPAVIVICVDITERKRAEEELKSAKMQAELYLDLMGHDISNMHQVAMGYLELARDLPPGDGQAKFVDKSMEVLQRSTKLIDNVRKLQKFRDGQFQAMDLDICRTLLDIQSEYVVVPDKTIILNLNGHEKCFVRANELLYDVFINLVNNAVKHTKESTEIVVDLDVTEDNSKHFYRVAVEDNGPGIPDKSKESIFNRMHMGSSRGMGLGLYIVRTLVTSYGGRVWAEDRVAGDHAKGARFVVMLPAV